MLHAGLDLGIEVQPLSPAHSLKLYESQDLNPNAQGARAALTGLRFKFGRRSFGLGLAFPERSRGPNRGFIGIMEIIMETTIKGFRVQGRAQYALIRENILRDTRILNII